ncbi:hypothetical protein RchiOBHm_Chr2g0134221 [Rosa chinensis]|uniref:Uncharacterized protein n=1 Tax=Rosa chinensis TaxID=74649 RepID=A0A2P6RVS7_ROSCH|nr:hypothetical protein RchiOBHm_Chr2g0134221 [Rosa chinensis]
MMFMSYLLGIILHSPLYDQVLPVELWSLWSIVEPIRNIVRKYLWPLPFANEFKVYKCCIASTDCCIPTCRTDSALKFGWCFLFYMGILAAIDVFPDHAVVGGIKFLKRNISIVHLF